MLPANILKVKEFLVRLVKDEAFRTELQNSASETTQKILKEAGYTFSKEEFDTASIELLDLKERDEFHELTEQELVGAIGGLRKWPFPLPFPFPWPQPMYGLPVPIEDPYPTPQPTPDPWEPHPIKPIDPIAQPMYGVPVPPDILDDQVFEISTDFDKA